MNCAVPGCGRVVSAPGGREWCWDSRGDSSSARTSGGEVVRFVGMREYLINLYRMHAVFSTACLRETERNNYWQYRYSSVIPIERINLPIHQDVRTMEITLNRLVAEMQRIVWDPWEMRWVNRCRVNRLVQVERVPFSCPGALFTLWSEKRTLCEWRSTD